ncbi:MAG: hypothetical protein EA384_07655 [Spirochaetaceae bacterium]|nr:MAG: hypothetical protein EA384_07655 [Spirochaetaceae bacterium]
MKDGTGRANGPRPIARRLFPMLPLLLLPFCHACALIDDLRNMAPLEVVSHIPARGFTASEALHEVAVRFSAPMDRSSAEEAFSLADAHGRIPGRFRWRRNGTEMAFVPHRPFAPATHYTAGVATSAEDRRGNSLRSEFEFSFRTGPDEGALTVLRHHPADGAEDQVQTIEIEFSRPMQRDTFYRAVSISPSVRMLAEWSRDDRVVIYTPLEPLAAGDRFTVTISPTATDRSGNGLAEEFRFSFVNGQAAQARPHTVRIVGSGASLEPVDTRLINRVGVEKDDSIAIEFTASVPISDRNSVISISPALSHSLSWAENYSAVILTPLQFLQPDEVHQLSVGRQDYRFVIDGPRSQTLRVEAIALSSGVSDGSPGFTELKLGDGVALLPSHDEIGAGTGGDRNSDIAVDFLITHAAQAVISPAAMMQAFRISSHSGSYAFSVLDYVIDPPDSPFSAGESRTVARMLIEARRLKEPANDIVRIELDEQLTDSLANRPAQRFRIEVNAQ